MPLKPKVLRNFVFDLWIIGPGFGAQARVRTKFRHFVPQTWVPFGQNPKADVAVLGADGKQELTPGENSYMYFRFGQNSAEPVWTKISQSDPMGSGLPGYKLGSCTRTNRYAQHAGWGRVTTTSSSHRHTHSATVSEDPELAIDSDSENESDVDAAETLEKCRQAYRKDKVVEKTKKKRKDGNELSPEMDDMINAGSGNKPLERAVSFDVDNELGGRSAEVRKLFGYLITLTALAPDYHFLVAFDPLIRTAERFRPGRGLCKITV
ncbi:hypothetical protein B0H14DRAFT_2607919 [Mycena olivaceomarginata]|nr:hypothetical protein B0H14DRAFT_2607919 [Mycena olivaceomarginata]